MNDTDCEKPVTNPAPRLRNAVLRCVEYIPKHEPKNTIELGNESV